MNITEKQIEEAIAYLASTDEDYGTLKGRKAGLEHRLKVCMAVETLKAEGKSVAEREVIARAGDAYRNLVDEYENTCVDLEIKGAKRKRADLMIEVWRTIQANRRTGNI